MLVLWVAALHAAEPIPLIRAEATFHAGGVDELAHVIDGAEAGPHGWSVSPYFMVDTASYWDCALHGSVLRN